MDPYRGWRRFTLGLSITLGSVAILFVVGVVVATLYEAAQTQVTVTSTP
jgi:hypothetical protein